METYKSQIYYKLCHIHIFKNFVLFNQMPQQGLQQFQKQIEDMGLLEYQALPSFRDVAHGGRLCNVYIY